MVQQSINRLAHILNTVPEKLLAISESDFAYKPLPHKWSKKEILGHLIDSATNNHHRFVRGQFEQNPEITYNQDKWNEFGFYQQIAIKQIIAFWVTYNQQLLEMMKRIPAESLERQVKTAGNYFTLAFLITDYVAHLEHHLKQITAYE